METIFLKLVNMSITAGWLVLAVILLRMILKKAPRAILCLLWGIVGIRLILPVSLESALSLIPSTETVPENIGYAANPTIASGISAVNSIVNPLLQSSLAPDPTYIASVNPMQIVLFVAAWVWIFGMAGMLIYTLISYLRIAKKVRESAPLRDHIRVCDHIDTPFILGMFRPRIYLPSSINEADAEFVIAHEKAHLARRDHLWKPLGFLLLSVYWFNPLLWVAYVLLCRDIEVACDQKVIKTMGAEIKKPYSEALINCSVPRKMIAACPLAFGEVGVKSRIKSVLNYKKPAFWIIVAAIVTCLVISVCFLTDPPHDTLRVTEIQASNGAKFIEEPLQTLRFHRGDYYYETAFTEKLEKMLSKIELEPTYCEKDEYSEESAFYTIYGSNRLHFNQDCSECWINGNRSPSLVYQVKNKIMVSQFFSNYIPELYKNPINTPVDGKLADGNRYFLATIQNIDFQNKLLEVIPLEDTWESAYSVIQVGAESFYDYFPEYQDGDTVCIVYNGLVEEPAVPRISNIVGLSKATPYTERIILNSAFSSASYDIDNDGDVETLSLGVSSSEPCAFTLTISGKNGTEYFCYVSSPAYYSLRLTAPNGIGPSVCGSIYDIDYNLTDHFYKIEIENESLLLRRIENNSFRATSTRIQEVGY